MPHIWHQGKPIGGGDRFACLCCGYATLGEEPPGTYTVCSVCFWEDDPVQADDPKYAGGANEMSLEEARVNFKTFGAVSREYIRWVRPPLPEEIP